MSPELQKRDIRLRSAGESLISRIREDAPKNRLRRRRQFGARTQHEGSVHRNCRIHRLFQGRGSHNERQTKIKDNFILSLSRKGLCSDANAIPFFYDI